jgi:hypothetical protein
MSDRSPPLRLPRLHGTMIPVVSLSTDTDGTMKVAGTRPGGSSAAEAMALQQLLNRVRTAQGYGGICRKGVYRFRTHEEADQWLMKQLVQRAVRRTG